MKQELNTLELARLYEGQGHFRQALDIYKELDSHNSSNEIQAGIKRMKKRIENQSGDELSVDKINALIEELFSLLALEHRVNNMRKISDDVVGNE